MWNGCVKIIENGEKLPSFENSHAIPLHNHILTLRGQSVQNVWYDTVENLCFSENSTFQINPSDFLFFSKPEDFINDRDWGDFRLQNTLGIPLGLERKITSEYIISHHRELEKYSNSSIMLVGAGPSTVDSAWENLDNIDYVWSCNSYFLNQKMKDIKVDLAFIGPEVDITNQEFLDKAKRDKTFCVFEGGVTPYRPHKEIEELHSKLDGRVGYIHLRFLSKLGAGVRLIPTALFLGAKDIYFVGIDGHPINQIHAFEGKNKAHHGAPLVGNSYNIYRRQFTLMWDYFLKLNEEYQASFYNLGEKFEHNQSRDISLEKFPLSDKIKSIIY